MSFWDGVSTVSDQLFFAGLQVAICWGTSKISKGGEDFKKGKGSNMKGGGPTTLPTMVTETFCQDQLNKKLLWR